MLKIKPLEDKGCEIWQYLFEGRTITLDRFDMVIVGFTAQQHNVCNIAPKGTFESANKVENKIRYMYEGDSLISFSRL